MNTNKPQILFATNNAHKLDEIRAILSADFDVLSLADIGFDEDIPETADNLSDNALEKVQYVHHRFPNIPYCFADDTGLEVKALDGRPGVHTARYAFADRNDTEANTTKLLSEMQGKSDRTARFRTVIALIHHNHTELFEGIVEGAIATERRGTQGFGYDPVFIPEDTGKTFAELGVEVKNRISHRARAVKKLCDFLKNQIQTENK